MKLRVRNLGILAAMLAGVLASCPASEEAPTTAATAQPTGQQQPASQESQPLDAADSTSWVGDAMDFSFTNFDGETVMASSYAGKPLVLNFWASW